MMFPSKTFDNWKNQYSEYTVELECPILFCFERGYRLKRTNRFNCSKLYNQALLLLEVIKTEFNNLCHQFSFRMDFSLNKTFETQKNKHFCMKHCLSA